MPIYVGIKSLQFRNSPILQFCNSLHLNFYFYLSIYLVLLVVSSTQSLNCDSSSGSRCMHLTTANTEYTDCKTRNGSISDSIQLHLSIRSHHWQQSMSLPSVCQSFFLITSPCFFAVESERKCSMSASGDCCCYKVIGKYAMMWPNNISVCNPLDVNCTELLPQSMKQLYCRATQHKKRGKNKTTEIKK